MKRAFIFFAFTLLDALYCYNCISFNDQSCKYWLTQCLADETYCMKSKSRTNRMTVRGCGRSCTPGEGTASMSGISYPITMECCQTDECNSALGHLNSLLLLSTTTLLALAIND